MMKCFFSHRYGFPQAEGYRQPSGKFIRTGADFISCLDCGHRRESPIQFERAESRQSREWFERETAEVGR